MPDRLPIPDWRALPNPPLLNACTKYLSERIELLKWENLDHIRPSLLPWTEFEVLFHGLSTCLRSKDPTPVLGLLKCEHVHIGDLV